MIDLILTRHIRILKLSNSTANKINLEFLGFRNELVTDLLVDNENSMFLDSISRIDKFLEKMHVKLHQLKKRILLIINEITLSIFKKEIVFLESNFVGLSYDRTKMPLNELFGLSYKESLDVIFQSVKNEVVSNYKLSISYNHPDSFLLEKFRGTNKFNYKDNIFRTFQNKLKTLVKSIISCFSSEVRFFFFFKNQDRFPFFTEALPISESKTKKSKIKLGVYLTSDFSPLENSDVWKGCLPHFNSTLTQVPLFSISEYKNFDYKDWFFSKSSSFQKEIIGENRYNLLNSNDDVPYSQIFDFSKSTISIENL